MGMHFNTQTQKTTMESYSGYGVSRTAVAAQAKPTVKSEEELKQEEEKVILERVCALLGVKITEHFAFCRDEREKESLYVKYEGEDKEDDDTQWEKQMKLLGNAKQLLKGCKYFDLISLT
jgi:hypothetical protein